MGKCHRQSNRRQAWTYLNLREENAGRPRTHGWRLEASDFSLDRMFVRHPWSVLRDELCHKDGHTLPTAKPRQTNNLGYSAGLGPPAATPQDNHLQGDWRNVASAQGSKRSRTPRRRPSKCFSIQEVERSWPISKRFRLEPNSPSLSDTVSLSGEWEFPSARAGAPGRKACRKASVPRITRQTRMKSTEHEPNIYIYIYIYEGDKFAKFTAETVRSRVSWCRQKAFEHQVEPYPLTVEKLQLFGSLLKRVGYRSAAAHMSAVKNERPWSDAFHLEMLDGRRACERGFGPPVKCGAFDMQRLAELRITSEQLCPMSLREGALCGCWWALREVQLSTARCMQVAFRNGRGCGLCIFDLPMSKVDPQPLGKKRTHSCTCLPNEVLCPVKVARKLHGAALQHNPAGAHPVPGMGPLWPSVQGKFASKRAATSTFQKLVGLAGGFLLPNHGAHVSGQGSGSYGSCWS